MVAWYGGEDDSGGVSDEVVDGAEDESAGESELFTPVEVDVEGLAGVVAGALFDKIPKADQIDSVDGASGFFEFSDPTGDLVDGLTDPPNRFGCPSVGFSGFA